MVTTNGSALNALPNSRYAVASGLEVAEKLILCRGSPDGCITTPIGSAVCLDIVNNELWVQEGANGSAWLHLISGSA